MVADILSSLPPSLTMKGGQDERKEQTSLAEVSASETAEKMVANIMSSFRGKATNTDEAAKVGGGSGGMGIDDEIGKWETAGVEDGSKGEGDEGAHSARQGCKDCR